MEHQEPVKKLEKHYPAIMVTLAIMLIIFSFHIQSVVDNRYKAEMQYDSIQTHTADKIRRCCPTQAAEAKAWRHRQLSIYSLYTKHINGESKFRSFHPVMDEEFNKKKE